MKDHKRKPSDSQLADRRTRVDMINRGIPYNGDKLGAKNKFIFLSWTLLRPREEDTASLFVIKTLKPVQWGKFVKAVTDALEDII